MDLSRGLHALRNARAARGRVNINKSVSSNRSSRTRGAGRHKNSSTHASLARGSALFGALSRAHPRARERTKRRQRRPRHHAHHRRRTAVNLCTPPLNIYSAPCQPIHGGSSARTPDRQQQPPAAAGRQVAQQPAGSMHSSRPAYLRRGSPPGCVRFSCRTWSSRFLSSLRILVTSL